MDGRDESLAPLALPPMVTAQMRRVVELTLLSHLSLSQVGLVMGLTKGQVSRVMQNYRRWQRGQARQLNLPRNTTPLLDREDENEEETEEEAADAEEAPNYSGSEPIEVRAFTPPTGHEIWMAWANSVIVSSRSEETTRWFRIARGPPSSADGNPTQGAPPCSLSP